MMESTPVVGVEIRNDRVDPLLAPCLLKEMDVGITPQEHRGSGIPNKAAFITESILPLPRCLATISGEKNTRRTPAKKNPNKR